MSKTDRATTEKEMKAAEMPQKVRKTSSNATPKGNAGINPDVDRYFQFLGKLRDGGTGAHALTSLDVLDNKIGGLSGLLGGVSAGALFTLQMFFGKEQAITWSLAVCAAFISAACLLASVLLCVVVLNIIGPHSKRMLDAAVTVEGASAEQSIKQIAGIYHRRVRCYWWSLIFLGAGTVFLIIALLLRATGK